jgi:hypothetical protein
VDRRRDILNIGNVGQGHGEKNAMLTGDKKEYNKQGKK